MLCYGLQPQFKESLVMPLEYFVFVLKKIIFCLFVFLSVVLTQPYFVELFHGK